MARPWLKNNVIFLFADREEVFIAGAQTFMQHPRVKDAGLTLIFEGYGIIGDSMLGATSPSNGWWIDEALRAEPTPLL